MDSRNDEVTTRQGLLYGRRLLPFSRLGRQLGEEARPAGSRERHRIQGEQQRKQTNRALCGCRSAAQKGSRLVGGGEGGGGGECRPGQCSGQIGGRTSPGWVATGQGVPLCVDRRLESAWPSPSPATSLLNRSGLVCPPTRAEPLTQDWGDKSSGPTGLACRVSPHPMGMQAKKGSGSAWRAASLAGSPGRALRGAWTAAEQRSLHCPAADAWRVGGQRPASRAPGPGAERLHCGGGAISGPNPGS